MGIQLSFDQTGNIDITALGEEVGGLEICDDRCEYLKRVKITT